MPDFPRSSALFGASLRPTCYWNSPHTPDHHPRPPRLCVLAPEPPSFSSCFNSLFYLRPEHSRVSGSARRLRVTASGELVLRNNGLPLSGNTVVFNRLIVTGLFPHHRPQLLDLVIEIPGNFFLLSVPLSLILGQLVPCIG